MVEDEFVELAAAIAVVREQLRQAALSGAGLEPRFAVGRVEVEFALEARREGGAKAGVQFGVVTVGAGGSVSSAATHRVRVELVPKTADGGDFEVYGAVDAIPGR